jgi:hypothetical protein
MAMHASGNLSFEPIWRNGRLTFKVRYPSAALFDHHQINRLADQAGYSRAGDLWTPPAGGSAVQAFSQALSRIGLKLEYVTEPDGAPFNLQRLTLAPQTRTGLETLQNFELYHLSGWTPVQAEGELDGRYWYFRARGTYWRFELGGNETGSRSARWRYEESWPSVSGFEAGYLTDEEAVSCILKAIIAYRTGDHGRFRPGHRDYERTIIDGWSLGALGLRIVMVRLGMSSQEIIERARAHGIELPYTTDLELRHLNSQKTPHRLRLKTRRQTEISLLGDGD